jgi:hypothetical protein
MPGSPVNIVPTLLICYFGWRVIRRIRRNIGPQPLKPRRMIFRIAIYAALIVFFAIIALAVYPSQPAFAALGGGVLSGAALGLYGLHLTRFQTTSEGRFYTPNPYMGTAVSLLLVARLVYRVVAISDAPRQAPMQPQLFQSPLTYFVFGLLAGYYVAYFSGVLARGREKTPENLPN